MGAPCDGHKFFCNKACSHQEYVAQSERVAQVSDEQMKELAVRTETTNPWYWGVRTLVKVSSSALTCHSTIHHLPISKMPVPLAG